MENNSFLTLNGINVNERVEKKNGLSYLSWAWAWAEIKKVYPDAAYEIKKFDGAPYLHDKNLGYMVFTSVTIGGQTYEMWLPVMDSNNKAMKDEPYTIQTKYKEVTIKAADMFDINKTIMRCLVKNLAMFGLGLYIYAGEDLPESEDPPEPPRAARKTERDIITEYIKQYPALMTKLIGGRVLEDLTNTDYGSMMQEVNKYRQGIEMLPQAIAYYAKAKGITPDAAKHELEEGAYGKKLNEQTISSVEDIGKILREIKEMAVAAKKEKANG